MMWKSLPLFIALTVSELFISCNKATIDPPKPFGAIPTEDQMNWQKMEYYMFVHFGPNTFTDVEWGSGKEDPKVFNPTNVDCDQWAATAKAAGMKGIIITSKHHDGFCLWPSKYSTHTVRESAWKDGNGDILKELSAACKKYGLKLGVYLSPWDQNHPAYGTPEYNQIFANTLNEVLTNYGDIFEVWFDGANGGTHGNKSQLYDWNLFHNTVYKNQPNAIIFSDVGPGCRWMGNEQGIAGKTNWSTLNIEGFEPGAKSPPIDTLSIGNKNGTSWVPAETDVSIRPGWFYSSSTDNKVKTIDDLVKIYYSSIGRNSNLLLNVPPDRDGRIHKIDSTRLMEFRKIIDESFANNLTKGSKITASQTRGNSDKYGASNVLDNKYDSYWTTNDDITSATIDINFGKQQKLNTILLQEYIPLGQRIEKFTVKYWDEQENKWERAISRTTIGYKRIVRFKTIETSKLRIKIDQSLACPIINNIEVYYTPEKYIHNENSNQLVRTNNDYPTDRWKIISTTNKKINNIIDGTDESVYILNNEPIIIDFDEELDLKGFFYIPKNDVSAANVLRYNFYISQDRQHWSKIKSEDIFNNIKNNPIRQDIHFNKTEKAKYIKFEPVDLTNDSKKYVVIELGVLTK